MKRMMKAAVLWDLNQPLKIIELPVKKPGKGQVLVKMAASGICHTQLLEIQGKNASGPMNPNMLGHEGSGIVEEIGEEITKVSPGEHVILSWIKGTGANVLPEKYDYNGFKINAGFVTTFNEYALVSENRVTPIHKEMPFKEAALIGCSVATGAGAVINNAKVKCGQSVVVVGIGGVGINMVHAAALNYANPLIAVDINEDKLEIAKKFGATHVLNSSKCDIETELKKIASESGLDYAFDTTGRKEVMEMIYRSVKKASGKVVLCGVPNPLELKIEIDPFPLYYGRKIVGTGGGETNPDVDFPKLCSMFLNGQLKLSEMISHTITLDEINKGFDYLKNGQCLKVVIDFTKR